VGVRLEEGIILLSGENCITIYGFSPAGCQKCKMATDKRDENGSGASKVHDDKG
jgi:hypothetical protein